DGSLLRYFYAFDPSFTGGVFVAAGDVNGDGGVDIVVGAGAGTNPGVGGFSGRTTALVADFSAVAPAFIGGVRVAVGAFNNDVAADLVVAAGPGGPPQVKVIDAARLGQVDGSGVIRDSALLRNIYAFDPSYTGGIYVAAGDVNGNGGMDLVVG